MVGQVPQSLCGLILTIALPVDYQFYTLITKSGPPLPGRRCYAFLAHLPSTHPCTSPPDPLFFPTIQFPASPRQLCSLCLQFKGAPWKKKFNNSVTCNWYLTATTPGQQWLTVTKTISLSKTKQPSSTPQPRLPIRPLQVPL